MLSKMELRLRRSNVVLNSFSSCVSNASEKYSGTPEMSFSKMVSKPRMFFKKLKGTVPFKQLKSFANTHGWRELDKQVDMINSDVKFINLTFMPDCSFTDESVAINFEPIKLKRISSIFSFEDKMESILSKGMFETLQIHFLSPKSAGDGAHAKLCLIREPISRPSDTNHLTESNFEDGDTSQNLRVWVSSPWM